MKIKNIVLVLFALLFQNPSRADIIFVDLNGSNEEIAAAREGLKARYQKELKTDKNAKMESVLEIPSFLAPDKKSLDDLRPSVELWEARFNGRKCGDPIRFQSKTCKNIVSNLDPFKKSRDKILDPYHVNYINFTAKLSELAKQNRNISSVIISGHDGSADFSGIQGDLNAADLQKAFSDNPDLRKNISVAYLWGCYTAMIGAIEIRWKKIFPAVRLFLGYDDMSPANTRDSGQQYLTEGIEKEKLLLSAKSLKELRQIFRNFRAAKGVASALQLDNLYLSRSASYDLSKESDRDRSCQMPKIVESGLELWRCYQNAEGGCDDVPGDVHTGPLRDFYGYMQAVTQCRDNPRFAEQYAQFPDPQQVLHLIFFRSIKANIARQMSPILQEIDSVLTNLGAAPNLRFANLADWRRIDLIQHLRQLKDFITVQKDIRRQSKNPQIAMLLEFYWSINQVLIGLSGDCIPLSWVTTTDSSQESKCIAKNHLGFPGVAKLSRSPSSQTWNDLFTASRERSAIFKKIKSSEGETFSAPWIALQAQWQGALKAEYQLKQYFSENGDTPITSPQEELDRAISFSDSHLTLEQLQELNRIDGERVDLLKQYQASDWTKNELQIAADLSALKRLQTFFDYWKQELNLDDYRTGELITRLRTASESLVKDFQTYSAALSKDLSGQKIDGLNQEEMRDKKTTFFRDQATLLRHIAEGLYQFRSAYLQVAKKTYEEQVQRLIQHEDYRFQRDGFKLEAQAIDEVLRDLRTSRETILELYVTALKDLHRVPLELNLLAN